MRLENENVRYLDYKWILGTGQTLYFVQTREVGSLAVWFCNDPAERDRVVVNLARDSELQQQQNLQVFYITVPANSTRGEPGSLKLYPRFRL